MQTLTALQRDTLFAIAGHESPNGREIERDLERTQEREFVSGHIYAVFEELVDAGFVEKSPRNGRSNDYALTDRGRSWVDRRYRWEQSYVRLAASDGAGRPAAGRR